MELPPAPDEMTFTPEDRAFYEGIQETFSVLFQTVEKINEWTDSIAMRVDPDTLDRRTREGMSLIIWRAEFIEKVLKNHVPPVAVMEMVDYMRNQMGNLQIQMREMTEAEVKERGYL